MVRDGVGGGAALPARASCRRRRAGVAQLCPESWTWARARLAAAALGRRVCSPFLLDQPTQSPGGGRACNDQVKRPAVVCLVKRSHVREGLHMEMHAALVHACMARCVDGSGLACVCMVVCL